MLSKEKLGREVGVNLVVRDGCEDSICKTQPEISKSGRTLSWERKYFHSLGIQAAGAKCRD